MIGPVRRAARLLAYVGLAVALAAAVFVGGGAPAQAAVTPPPGQWVELFNPLAPLVDGRFHVCMDVPSGTSDDEFLWMYHCHGHDGNGGPQRFTFIHLSGDAYWIQNVQSGKCLTPGWRATTNPRPSPPFPRWINLPTAIQRTCGSFDGQAWRLAPSAFGSEYFALRNDSPNYAGKCLTAQGFETSRVEWWDCDTTWQTQTWTFG